MNEHDGFRAPFEVVLIDPLHLSGLRFMRTFFSRYQARTVCVYTSAEAVRRLAPQFPELRSAMVSAHYLAEEWDAESLARVLRRDHRIRAVVPFAEWVVRQSDELAGALGLDWAQPSALRLFRDKFALKDHLRGIPGGPRVNASARVATLSDVRDRMLTMGAQRYVLKPNDGMGNTDVLFLDPAAPDDLITSHLARDAGAPMLLEEFVGGEEYWVNGQIDGSGGVTVVSVARYIRRPMNGRENIDVGTRYVHHADPVFGELATYASSVIAATGLSRSPFHLEAKVDDRGPCLIEVGARLIGMDQPPDDGIQHGGLFNAHDVAAHYYLSAADYGPLGLDWAAYDSRWYGHVTAYATQDGRIGTLLGLEDVEAMPEFVRWTKVPRPGDRVERTVDLGRVPWQVALAASSPRALEAAADRARSLIRWDTPTDPAGKVADAFRRTVPPVARRTRRAAYARSIRPIRVAKVPGSPSSRHLPISAALPAPNEPRAGPR